MLQDKIGEIVSVEYQKTINESGFSKGTRMDVWVTDIQGRVFDVELPVYTFRSLCAEQSDIILQDGAVKIIINSSAAAKEENEDLRVFMDYMNGEKAEHPFIEEVEAEVTAVKENDVYRAEFFSWNAKAMDLKRAGRKEGFQRGIQQGVQQKALDDISKMAVYLQSQDPALTEDKAREMAERILR